MADASCEQCGLARPAGAATCPRCGWEYAASAAGAAQALVLRAAAGQALAGEWRIEAGQTTLGRSHTADVVLTHDSVSRQHARIVREAQGFVVEDLGSHNWTLVNGERITAPRLIADGDQLTIGEVALEARLEVIAAIELLPAASTAGGSATMLIDLEDEPAAAAVPPPIDLAPAQEQPTTRPRRAKREDNGHEAATPAPSPEAEPAASAAPAPSQVAACIAQSASELAATLGRLEQQLAAAATALAAAGGRPVLVELLEQARQTAASPTDVRALMALGATAEAAANLLALELQLVDVLWPSAGAAGDDER